MASGEPGVALGAGGATRPVPSLLHVVDGLARNGRVRRVEYVRRFFHSQAIVVGCLDDECRCVGLGLRTLGSTPKRSLCASIAQAIRSDDSASAPPLICTWSTDLAIETSLMFSRQLLIAEHPAPSDLDPGSAASIEVIAPDATIARSWSHAGVRRTRILPPCALAAGAPVSYVAGQPLSVALVTSERNTEEEAIGLLHRVGLVQMGGIDVAIRVDTSDPRTEVMLEYAAQTGFASSMVPLSSDVFPGDAHVALVNDVRDVETDERVLDLTAQGVAVLTLHQDPCPEDPAISLETCGIERLHKPETNAGARILTLLAEDPELLHAAQSHARAFASTRDPRNWCSTLGVAASTLSD